jgi:hypothetical protein
MLDVIEDSANGSVPSVESAGSSWTHGVWKSISLAAVSLDARALGVCTSEVFDRSSDLPANESNGLPVSEAEGAAETESNLLAAFEAAGAVGTESNGCAVSEDADAAESESNGVALTEDAGTAGLVSSGFACAPEGANGDSNAPVELPDDIDLDALEPDAAAKGASKGVVLSDA